MLCNWERGVAAAVGLPIVKTAGLETGRGIGRPFKCKLLNININRKKPVKIKINATCKSNINMGKGQLMLHYGASTYMEAYHFNAAIRSQSDLRCHLPRAAGYNCL